MEIFFSFTSHYPKTPVPVVNNPIRSKYLHQTLVNFSASPAGDWQTGCLWWEVVESRFHVDLKSNCALINTSVEFLLGPIIRRINLLYESRMKWTWHYSKLAVEEVSFFGGLRVVLLQLLSIGDGAVGVTNLGIMLLWSGLNVFRWDQLIDSVYRQFSNISGTQSQNINVSRLVLPLSLPNPLQPGVKLRVKM